MAIVFKKEPENHDPIDLVHERSWLIRQQKTRIKSMIEMEPSNPKLSPHIDRAMRVYDSFLQSYLETCFDLRLLARPPKVATAYDAIPTPEQAKFRDQTMRGMQEQERAKAEAAQEEAVRREEYNALLQSYAKRGIALEEFPSNCTQEEWGDFVIEAVNRFITMDKNGLSH